MKKKIKTVGKYSLKEQMVPAEDPKQVADFAVPVQKPISLDQVVDRYIVRYERESIPLEGKPGPAPVDGTNPAVMESASLDMLMSFLLEQETPAATPAEEPPTEDNIDASVPDANDTEIPSELGDTGVPTGEEVNAPPVMNTPKINLNDFARSVARLVNNYDALLNLRTIIMNRVEAYIKTNYNEVTAKNFMNIMEKNYGIHPTDTEYPESGASEFPTPYAAGALIGSDGGGSVS